MKLWKKVSSECKNISHAHCFRCRFYTALEDDWECVLLYPNQWGEDDHMSSKQILEKMFRLKEIE